MEIFISKRKVVRGVLLGLLMTSVALIMSVREFYILFPADRSLLLSPFVFQTVPIIIVLVSIVGFFIFGAMTIVIFSRFFHTEPQIIINLEGFEDQRLGTGLIGWNEIEEFQWNETKYGAWLTIKLRSPEKYFHRLTKFQSFLRKANGQKGDNDLRIRFADLDTPIDEAWNFIEENVTKPHEAKELTLMP